MLFSGGVPTNQGRILDHLVDFGKSDLGKGDLSKVSNDGVSVDNNAAHKGPETTYTAPEAKQTETVEDGSNKEKTGQDGTDPQGIGSLHWLKYKQ